MHPPRGPLSADVESAPGTDFQLLHCTKSRRDPGTADMTDGLSGLNSGAHDPMRASGDAGGTLVKIAAQPTLATSHGRRGGSRPPWRSRPWSSSRRAVHGLQRSPNERSAEWRPVSRCRSSARSSEAKMGARTRDKAEGLDGARGLPMSAYSRIAVGRRTSRRFRVVPGADSCTAQKPGRSCRMLRRSSAPPAEEATLGLPRSGEAGQRRR
jgi:hypothetical protein